MADSGDVDQLVDNDELSQHVQPHLQSRTTAGADDRSNSTGPEYVNPALQLGNETDTAAESKNTTNGNVPQTQTPTTTVNGTHSVYYENRNGSASVVQEPVMVTRPDGSRVIQTHEYPPERWRDRERPLRQKHIKLLKVFSVVAIVVFFPLGIPALYYAFRTEKEFHEGIMRGNIDLARKFAKRTERLIIFSILCALLTAVIVFALVERAVMADNEEYWNNRSQNRVIPSG